MCVVCCVVCGVLCVWCVWCVCVVCVCRVCVGHRSADWGAIAGVMCDRCSRITTVAEERFSRLVNATPKDFGGGPPGRLSVGSCSDAVQWAGYHHELSMDSQ